MKTLSLYCWVEGIIPVILIASNRLFNESACNVVYSVSMTMAILIALFSFSFHPGEEARKTVRLQVAVISIIAVINVLLAIYFKYVA